MDDGQWSGFIKDWFYQGWLGYVWFMVLAVWGGTASYISRLKRQHTPFSLVELIGEWSISGFSGLVTALICVNYEFPFEMTAAFAGIAGHMGGRGIQLLEDKFTSVVDRWKSPGPRQ